MATRTIDNLEIHRSRDGINGFHRKQRQRALVIKMQCERTFRRSIIASRSRLQWCLRRHDPRFRQARGLRNSHFKSFRSRSRNILQLKRGLIIRAHFLMTVHKMNKRSVAHRFILDSNVERNLLAICRILTFIQTRSEIFCRSPFRSIIQKIRIFRNFGTTRHVCHTLGNRATIQVDHAKVIAQFTIRILRQIDNARENDKRRCDFDICRSS